MTSKLQVTVPKRLAQQYGIRPGDEIEWVAAGGAIRVALAGAERQASALSLQERLRLFDAATERLRQRASKRRRPRMQTRGWNREDLYVRGRTH